jgi:hypothetical protein
MFALLGVDSVETEMSFRGQPGKSGLEWAGSNLATVFGQKRNLVRRSSGRCSPTSCASTAKAFPGWLTHPATSAACAIS